MKRTLGNAIIFGNIDASSAPAGRIDYNGLLKFLHTGFLTGASAFLTYLVLNIGGIDLNPASSTDEMMITLFVIPVLKIALTWLPSHEAQN